MEKPQWNSQSRWLFIAVILLIAAGARWWSVFQPTSAVRPSLAVLEFEPEVSSEDSVWLASALRETLVDDLAANGALRLIPSETVAQMGRALAIDSSSGQESDAYLRLGEVLNADYIVHGVFRILQRPRGRQVSLDLTLRETRSRETKLTIEHIGIEAQLFELVSKVASELRQALRVKHLSFVEQRSVRATHPSSLQALRFYVEGLDKLRSSDALSARRSLTQAIDADPSYARAHALLSRAMSALGFDLEAEEIARRAYDLVEGLPSEDRLRIEGRYFESAAEWAQAIRTYEALWRLFPGSVDYGLRLAEAQVMAGRGHEALSTVDALRQLPNLGEVDPRIDLAEARAANSLSDFRRQLEASRQAAEKGQALGAATLTAAARQSQGEAHFQLFETEQATAAFEEARYLFATAGDRGKVAEVLSRIADVLSFEKDTEKAFELYRQALAMHRQTGDRKGVSEVQNSLAFQLYQQGNLVAARAMLEEAVAIGREIGDRNREADYLDTLIDVLLRAGDLEAARELAQEERAIYRELGNREGFAWSYYYLGKIALAAGDVRRAKSLHDEALLISDEVANPYLTGFVLDALAKSLAADGDVAGALRLSADSRRLRSELDFKNALAQSQITSATILLEKGRPEDAERLAREAIEFLKDRARADEVALGAATLSHALVAQGRVNSASSILREVRADASKSQNPTVRMSVAIAEAELFAVTGRRRQATELLESVVAEAHQLGLIKLELEARFIWGKIELGQGRRTRVAASGRERLEVLSQKAEELGYGLLARKASLALSSLS